MFSVLATLHIILSVFLIVLVLIQDPKGGATGGLFGGGGGSNSLFGATGAPSFLAKLTRWIAFGFAISCIVLTISLKPKSDSVLDSLPPPAATDTKEVPAQPTTETPETQPEQK